VELTNRLDGLPGIAEASRPVVDEFGFAEDEDTD
jgi:hypothetical protein